MFEAPLLDGSDPVGECAGVAMSRFRNTPIADPYVRDFVCLEERLRPSICDLLERAEDEGLGDDPNPPLAQRIARSAPPKPDNQCARFNHSGQGIAALGHATDLALR